MLFETNFTKIAIKSHWVIGNSGQNNDYVIFMEYNIQIEKQLKGDKIKQPTAVQMKFNDTTECGLTNKL